MKQRSATDIVRDELIRVRAGNDHDRRAELAGLLRASGTLQMRGGGGLALEAVTEHAGVARRLVEAVREAIGGIGEVRLVEPGKGHPRQRYLVHVEEVGMQRLVEAGLLDEGGVPTAVVPRRLVAKRCCAAAYLRGAFLARGSVNGPAAPAHLEIRADSEAGADDVAALLVRVGAQAQVREHRGFAAYVKRVEDVGRILAAMGAHDAYLRLESGSVLKEVHVQASRLANADAANARRTAGAAIRHLAAIDRLDRAGVLERLPSGLREIAALRRARPGASIEELGRACRPRISKPAAAGRLRRLVQLAESLGQRGAG